MTDGAGPDVNGFFGIMTMVIAVPTEVKIFNWLFTTRGGRIRFEVSMLWALGFMVTFVIGGMTGVLLAVPPVDFVLHNSLFLAAHFRNVLIGGVSFGPLRASPTGFLKCSAFVGMRFEVGSVVVLGGRFLRRLPAAACAGAGSDDASDAILRG